MRDFDVFSQQKAVGSGDLMKFQVNFFFSFVNGLQFEILMVNFLHEYFLCKISGPNYKFLS